MKRTLFTLAAALLSFAVVAQDDRYETSTWFHDANVHFSLIRALMHNSPQPAADTQRELRRQCLELSTEYNKRAADRADAWFTRRQLPTRLSARDCT